MIFAEYDYRCVLCGFAYADTLHHEPPRSLNPRWKDEPWTQYPVCNNHHEALHAIGDRDMAHHLLNSHVDIFAPGAIERIQTRATEPKPTS
jgi:hypothetical protein